MSSTTTVVLITSGDEGETVAALNGAWHDRREQFVEADAGGYKYGDPVWACVFNSLDRDLLLEQIRWQRWAGAIWVLIKHEDALAYEMLTLGPPEPGAVQPSPFTVAGS